jgi:UDP-glucose 4-epimerase
VTWLVTGGAGYIGAHVVHTLRAADERVVVLDNLSTGLAKRVPDDVPLVAGDVCDPATVTEVIRAHRATGVIHLAARKDVGESVRDPLGYYGDNLGGLRAILAGAAEHGARDVVYSSSAAVYGPAGTGRVTEGAGSAASHASGPGTFAEDSPTVPGNPYGRSKLVGEWMLADAAAAHGLRYAALRYFNVAGALHPALGDIGQTNLVPRLLRAVVDERAAQVYGTAHPTPDGTCIRDYVHVGDIADAHLAAARGLREGRIQAEILNIGRGTGVSVLEMIRAVRRVCDRPLPADATPPRAGDPPRVVADAQRIADVLGWRASRDLDEIISSAWTAYPRS